MLGSVAGSSSAFAMYNVSKLQFLYLTRLDSARAMETALWKAKSNYEVRHAGNTDYYRKEDPQTHRIAAFAITGDVLLLATRDDLMGGALELAAHPSNPSLASEPWFESAAAAEPPGAGELRMVYNMDRLAATYPFRSYWIQSNVPDLRQFSSGVSDIERATGKFRERRVLLRAQAASPVDEAPTGKLLAIIPTSAGFYRATLSPNADRVLSSIAAGLFPSTPTPSPTSLMAPVATETGEAGKEEDLETRIDQPPITDTRSAIALEPLRNLLTRVRLDAMLHWAPGTSPGTEDFVRPRSAVVLLASSPWDANAIRSAFSAAAAGLWTNGGLGAGWRGVGERGETLDGLGKVAIAIDGAYLIASDSPELAAGDSAPPQRSLGSRGRLCGWVAPRPRAAEFRAPPAAQSTFHKFRRVPRMRAAPRADALLGESGKPGRGVAPRRFHVYRDARHGSRTMNEVVEYRLAP